MVNRTETHTRMNSKGGTGPSLADQAFTQLQDRLIFLDIAPGEPLNETLLGAELGVGRTPLREALKRLESERLVATFPRRGTFATSVDITVLSEISEVRAVLEPLAVELACKRLDAAGRAELEGLRDRMGRVSAVRSAGASGACSDVASAAYPAERPAGHRAGHPAGHPVESSAGLVTDPQDALRRDNAVHRAIYRASGNSHLEATLVRYGNLATRIWCVAATRNPTPEEHIAVHAQLLDAVLAGRATEAVSIMRAHIEEFEQHMRRVL